MKVRYRLPTAAVFWGARSALLLAWVSPNWSCDSAGAASSTRREAIPSQNANQDVNQDASGDQTDAKADTGIAASAGAAALSGTADTGSGSLRIHIEDATRQPIQQVQLACSDDCITVRAFASGGHPPYTYRWSDGSSSQTYELCPGSAELVTVTASDTGVNSPEFELPSTSVEAMLQVHTLQCPEGGPTDEAMIRQCRPYAGEACELGGAQLPDEVTVDVLGTPKFFVDGAALPAGRYRISYVDGCNTYGVGAGWTVHGLDLVGDLASCNVVDEAGGHVARTPGTTGIFADGNSGPNTAFESYDACVAANCELGPVDFDFDGGKLAVRRDGVSVGAVDDAGGETIGGRSPTFRLSFLGPCE